MPRSLPLPVTILLLVILSGLFHTLIRSNLQATTFRTSLQPTSLDDDLDSSASARVSLLLTEAVQRGAGTRPPQPALSSAPPASSAADASAAAAEPSDKTTEASTTSQEAVKIDRSYGRTPPATSARAAQAMAAPAAVEIPEAVAEAVAPESLPESLPATCTAAAACAACELRWLHWNLQQRPGRPAVVLLLTLRSQPKVSRRLILTLTLTSSTHRNRRPDEAQL